jgi:hypothetical protein
MLSIANTTIAQPGSATSRSDKVIYIESTARGFEPDESTRTPKAVTISLTEAPMVIIEESATGFDSPPITTSLRARPEQTPEVIVTNTPTVISIHTEIATTATGYLNNEVGPDSEATPQPTSDGLLLNEIISRIGNPHPGAQPNSQQASPTADAIPDAINESAPLGDDNTVQAISTTLAVTEAPGAQPALLVGEPITLGAATLTLSNGLSTTVGTGSTATFVAFTTNPAGYTVIVVSSSGTAVTATISNAPVTITMPKTGWEASVTAAARFGNDPSVGTPTSTSSKGAAANARTWDSYIGILLGIIATGAIR